MSVSLNPEKLNPLQHKSYPSQTSKKVNLFNQIFTQEIEKIKYSYSIISKTSESGLYQNQRMILLNHSSCLGYASIPNQIQQLPYMKKQKLPKLKCFVKLSDIKKVENSKKVLWISFYEGKIKENWEFQCATSEMALSWAKIILLSMNENQMKQHQKQKGQKGKIRQKIFENLGEYQTSKKQKETKLIVFDEKGQEKNDANVDKEFEQFLSNEEKGNQEQRKDKEQNQEYFEYPNLEYQNIQSDEQIQYEKDLLWAQLQAYKNKCHQYEKKVEQLHKMIRNTSMSKDEEIEDLKRRIQVLQNQKINQGKK